MFLSIGSVVLLSIGSLFALIYIILLAGSRKYKDFILALDEKNYPLHDLYGVGYRLLDVIHYRYNSKRELERHKEFELVYGERYADFYLSANAAQRITLSFTLFIAGFAFFGIVNDITVLMVFFMFSGVAYYYYATLASKVIKKKSEELLSEFPDVVAKLALLINAGMIMKEAWKKIAFNGTGLIYEEMKKTVDEMENGKAELDAYYDFGVRCVIPEIKKFTSTMMQGLVKGNQEFAIMIREQSKEMWEKKQHLVKQQGEKAASKLLLPICLMFIGILIMIIVPIFTNLGV
ncbi:type II secretion system F family protein [Anaerocolumna xylanovorans]|uniref:Type II secretion system protein F (GspF) n=1 Tax=Anaerocolumna xylanovorans DSM 12503 TaxID=1121345 RepID=A0A1M7YJM9_9FIRM|nr:type II secretion system F family protein [Anaerocolumna xylanovorans]SHO52831.1 type II secretion system protein F (GspF) [Anaerocolumna xylanovorans DSM 12503]